MTTSRKSAKAPVSVLKKVLTPLQQFLEMEASGGLILIACSVLALLWANSPLSASYFSIWEHRVTVGIEAFMLDKPLILWINDGLMAVFFFLVGLEIKREVLVGELSSVQKASLPFAAAIGGMVVPALLFWFLERDQPAAAQGWGIPMATDIAFSLGMLKILGKRAPLSLKIFLTAFAIFDDIGAVIVIAIFYSSGIQTAFIAAAFFCLLVAIALNRFHVSKVGVYLLVGIIMWIFLLKSGVHPTIAGVLMAFCIPANRKINLSDFYHTIENGLHRLGKPDAHKAKSILLNRDQLNVLDQIEDATNKVQSPLQRLENALHSYVIYLVMPVFAIANAGVALGGPATDNTLGTSIAVGLFAGKFIGIFFFSWIAVKAKLASLPADIKWADVAGASFLGGVGFTMSLFVANLAYEDATLISSAKSGVLIGSLLSAIAGLAIIWYSRRHHVHSTYEDGEDE